MGHVLTWGISSGFVTFELEASSGLLQGPPFLTHTQISHWQKQCLYMTLLFESLWRLQLIEIPCSKLSSVAIPMLTFYSTSHSHQNFSASITSPQAPELKSAKHGGEERPLELGEGTATVPVKCKFVYFVGLGE